MGALLEGSTRDWLHSLIKEYGAQDFANYTVFVMALMIAFGEPNPKDTDERELNNVEYGTGIVSVFNAEFSRIMYTLWCDDVAKQGPFSAKLSHQVTSALVTLKNNHGLKAFVTECIHLDNNISTMG